MLDNKFVTAHDWALASDGMQWILLHNHRQDGTGRWQAVSFVHSTRDILARCMREKGCPAEDARQLLKGLPLTFNEWQRAAPQRASTGDETAAPRSGSGPLLKTLAARSAIQPDVRSRRTQAIKKAMCAAQTGAQSNLQPRLAAARRMLRYAPANMGPIRQIGSHPGNMGPFWQNRVPLGKLWVPSAKLRVPFRKRCKTGICSRGQ